MPKKGIPFRLVVRGFAGRAAVLAGPIATKVSVTVILIADLCQVKSADRAFFRVLFPHLARGFFKSPVFVDAQLDILFCRIDDEKMFLMCTCALEVTDLLRCLCHGAARFKLMGLEI